MTIFLRPWLAPSPPFVADPLSVGIWFLVNSGYGGPISEDMPVRTSWMAATTPYNWPPTRRARSRVDLVRQSLTAFGQSPAIMQQTLDDVVAVAMRADDDAFAEDIANTPASPLIMSGVCLEPAAFGGDVLQEDVGASIVPGDIVAVVLRGVAVPLVKVYAGQIERSGQRRALFYLAMPEQLIESPLDDVLYISRLHPPRDFDGHALLAAADPFVGKLVAEHGVEGDLPAERTRVQAWAESMVAIFAEVRALKAGQPE